MVSSTSFRTARREYFGRDVAEAFGRVAAGFVDFPGKLANCYEVADGVAEAHGGNGVAASRTKNSIRHGMLDLVDIYDI
jgi:hypothetical protein